MADILDEMPERLRVPDLDEILGRHFPCLDKGFVRVVDYLGGDASIVQAARISYGRGTKTVSEDAGLIRYLLRHRHTTPLEMCEIKLHVRVPMDTWRQWIRHRTANVNEYSTRYSVAIDDVQQTPAGEWRLQSHSNRQGSSGYLAEDIGSELSHTENSLQQSIRAVYQDRIAKGVAREQARKDLPLSTYTEAYWKIDLWNLFHFLELRMAPQAQYEIRQYANAIGHEIVRRWVPVAWQAFLDYHLNSLRLSAHELEIIKHLIHGDRARARDCATTLGWLRHAGGATSVKVNREGADFMDKLRIHFGYELE